MPRESRAGPEAVTDIRKVGQTAGALCVPQYHETGLPAARIGALFQDLAVEKGFLNPGEGEIVGPAFDGCVLSVHVLPGLPARPDCFDIRCVHRRSRVDAPVSMSKRPRAGSPGSRQDWHREKQITISLPLPRILAVRNSDSLFMV